MARLTEADLGRVERVGVTGVGELQALVDQSREALRFRHALEDICRRHEKRDTGEGFAKDAGPLAWAMWRVAKDALEEEVSVG